MKRTTPESLQAPESLAQTRNYTVATAVDFIAQAINAAPVQPRITYEQYLQEYRGGEQPVLDAANAQNVIDMTARRSEQMQQERQIPADVNDQGTMYVQEAA